MGRHTKSEANTMKTQQEGESGWQLETETARAYEEDLVPALFIPWAHRLLDQAQVGTGAHVLDLACGTGAVARHAAPRVGPTGSVTGVDLNAGMLEVAEAVTRDIRPTIDWKQADATELPFADRRFDTVLCQQGLQFMPERSKVLAEAHRVLRDDGTLALAVWRNLEHNPAWAALSDTITDHVSPEAGEIMRSPFQGPDGDTLRNELEQAGFDPVHVRIESRDLRVPRGIPFYRRQGDSSPFAPEIAALDEKAWERFQNAIDQALAPYMDDDDRVIPMQSLIITARK
jgi:ubiquinone/menaquinone biosynthesis C-methylase UbiE